MLEEARAAGATIGREPAKMFWGGYSGAFVDPEGHPGEIAQNPHWTIAPGRVDDVRALAEHVDRAGTDDEDGHQRDRRLEPR